MEYAQPFPAPKTTTMNESQSREIGRTQELTCVECADTWLDPSERWRVYLTDDEPQEAVLYCADCAHREFDP